MLSGKARLDGWNLLDGLGQVHIIEIPGVPLLTTLPQHRLFSLQHIENGEMDNGTKMVIVKNELHYTWLIP